MGAMSSYKIGPYSAFIGVAIASAVGCAWTATVCATIVGRFTQMETGFMLAVASMVMWPALMGLGISFFVYRSSITPRPKDLE